MASADSWTKTEADPAAATAAVDSQTKLFLRYVFQYAIQVSNPALKEKIAFVEINDLRACGEGERKFRSSFLKFVKNLITKSGSHTVANKQDVSFVNSVRLFRRCLFKLPSICVSNIVRGDVEPVTMFYLRMGQILKIAGNVGAQFLGPFVNGKRHGDKAKRLFNQFAGVLETVLDEEHVFLWVDRVPWETRCESLDVHNKKICEVYFSKKVAEFLITNTEKKCRYVVV